MIILTLPFPPSLNRIYRTRGGLRGVYLTKEGRDYKEAVAEIVAGMGVQSMTQRLHMFITAYMPDKRRRDIMNLEKITCDALQAAGVFDDDSQIDSFQIVRSGIKKGGELAVVITEMDHAPAVAPLP